MRKYDSMKNKIKQALSWLFVIISIAFIVSLFVFRDKLTSYSSNLMKSQVSNEQKNAIELLIDSSYNYTKNDLSYDVTFLEFGATNCAACKKMEIVLSQIHTKYPNKVNVIFMNVTEFENHDIMKYFGVSEIPTQVLLNKEGREYFRHTGYISSTELEKHLRNN